MKTKSHGGNFLTGTTNACCVIAFLVTLFLSHGIACATDFWQATPLSYSSGRSNLDSPPAFDTSGTVVATWQQDLVTTWPSVLIARSSNASGWSVNNIRSVLAPAGVSDRSPVVATDKAGNWLCVWSSDDTLSGTTGLDYDILYSRSEDLGITWSAPQVLNSTATGDLGADTEPSLSMDSGGNCLAVWTSENSSSDAGMTTQPQTGIWFSTSSDAGVSWSAAKSLPRLPSEALYEPQVGNNGLDSFGLVFASLHESESKLKFSYTDSSGTTWTTPATISTGPAPANMFKPALTADSSGKWMIAWNALDNSTPYSSIVRIARTETNGSTWLPVIEINDFGRAPSLYNDEMGVWCLGYRSSGARVMVSTDFGTNWESLPSFPSTVPAYPPGIPEPAESTPYIWRKSEAGWSALFGKLGIFDVSGKYHVRIANSLSAPLPEFDPAWQPAATFTTNQATYGYNPDLATANTSSWVAVFAARAPAATDDLDVFFVRSENDGVDWTAPQLLNSDGEADTADDKLPRISASEDQIWLSVWSRGFDILYARSLDDGATWSAPVPVTLPGDTPIAGQRPGISSLGDHTWLLCWQETGGIYTSRSTDDGLSWGPKVFVQSSYTFGTCGNISRCSNHSVSAPSVYCAPGSSEAYVGFTHSWTTYPSGYSQPSNSYEETAGHVSYDGGQTYSGNTNFSSWIGPAFKGTDEMATDGNGSWMSAKRSSNNSGITFEEFQEGGGSTSHTVPDVVGRQKLWGKVAMDPHGHRYRLWAARQFVDPGIPKTRILFSSSVDAGLTWSGDSLLDTTNANANYEPVTFCVKGSATGSFVAVWQANDASGKQTIWFSTNNKYKNNTAVSDWQMYQ